MTKVFTNSASPSQTTLSLISALTKILPPSSTTIQITQDHVTPRHLTITHSTSTIVFRIVDHSILGDADAVADEVVTRCDDMLFWMRRIFPGSARMRCCVSLTRKDDFYFLVFYRYVFRNGKRVDVERVGPKLILRLLRDERHEDE